MSGNTIEGNIAILQRLFFLRGEPINHTLVRHGTDISTELPLTKTGKIQPNPTSNSFFRVGLGTTLINPDGELAPSNMRTIDIRSVAMQGKLFHDVEDGMDKLPDLFFESLGVLNDEIENANQRITAEDLQQLGLNIGKLQSMGLTLEVINGTGMTLEQIAEIVGTNNDQTAQVVDMHGRPFSEEDFDGYGDRRKKTA